MVSAFGIRPAAFDDDADDMVGPFRILNDLLRQLGADAADGFADEVLILRGNRRGAIRQGQHAVVGAGVPLDGDAIEAAVHRGTEHELQSIRREARVGDEEPSMVAMFGPIIAAPLAMPSTVKLFTIDDDRHVGMFDLRIRRQNRVGEIVENPSHPPSRWPPHPGCPLPESAWGAAGR